MTDRGYTLDDLVDRTGFGKRQIRYYITEKLVPGAGDQRGPNAVYPAETLRRLEAIAVFKDQPVGPTGRAMTLAEIRHALDNMPEFGDNMPEFGDNMPEFGDNMPEFGLAQMRCSLDLEDLNSVSSVVRQPESALDYLNNSVCEVKSAYSMNSVLPKPSDKQSLPEPLPELLQNLKSLLTELGSDTRLDKQAGEGQSWQRLNSPDVEIQVRTPDTKEARRRLMRMAAQLGRLLEREE